MTDFDAIEKNVVRKTGPVSPCPPLAMLRAHADSVLPSDAEARIGAHLAQCTLCRMLVKDLPFLESQLFTPASRNRIRNISVRSKKPSAIPWFAIYAIAAGLAFIASLLITANRESTRQIATTQITQTNSQSDLPQLQLTKLPPPPPSVSYLVFRGAVSASEPDAAELTPAFAAYNSNNYALAAARFTRLATRFPNSDIPILYLGVSQLLSGNNSAALTSLNRADAIAKPRQKSAASWYHAAAALLAHSPDAPALLRSACNRTTSPYSQRACSLSDATEPNQVSQNPRHPNPTR